MLEALDRVRTPVRLVLAGRGSRPGRSARGPGRSAPPHAVVCLPFAADVLPLYRLLEIVLLPSRMEGFSQALLEAMALGKPVIASAAGGNPELIRDGVDGLLVPRSIRAAWAAAIERLLADAALAARLGAAARAHRPRQRFSLERTVERTLELYRVARARGAACSGRPAAMRFSRPITARAEPAWSRSPASPSSGTPSSWTSRWRPASAPSCRCATRSW